MKTQSSLLARFGRFSALTVLALSLAGVTACGSKETSSTTAPAAGDGAKPAASAKPVELLNVSYDPTRELYVSFNKAFQAYWKKEKGQDVTFKQSHGGSASRAAR